MPTPPTSHDERVARVVETVRARAANPNGPVSLGKAAVSHFVPNPNDPRHKDRKLDVRALREIISIDADKRRAVAEPGVTFRDLVAETLKVGLVPKLVPELETITIGGAVSGCSVEGMSYKYGGFHDSCLEYEMVTGTGEVLRCSREKDPLLFDMLHGSYGTLGILTELTFELVPAKPHVRMEYRKSSTFAAFEADMRAAMADPGVDFVDAILHAPDELVLCLGRFADLPEGVKPSNYRFLDIFYKSTRKKSEDWLTTIDYFFRYDTECHWLTRTLPLMETKVARLLLGKLLLGSTNLITWSKRLRPILRLDKHPDVVVDVFIPDQRLGEFFDWYKGAFDYWPLWIVPYKMGKPYPWISDTHAGRAGSDMFIDCAVYGKRNNEKGKDYSQMLEEKTYELGGIKTLISKNHYTRERFWDIYSQPRWQEIKQRTDPKGMFRDLYEKFNF